MTATYSLAMHQYQIRQYILLQAAAMLELNAEAEIIIESTPTSLQIKGTNSTTT